MTQNVTDALRVLHIAGLRFIYAPQGQGADLRRQLAAQGIEQVVQRDSGLSFDRLELPAGVDGETVQGVLDDWAE